MARTVFKTVESCYAARVGSIPIRLRHSWKRKHGQRSHTGGCKKGKVGVIVSLIDKVTALATGAPRREPVGAVHVVDPSPLNWLHITYNVVEELIRVDHQGNVQAAAMRQFHWLDDRTLHIDVREDQRFPDGEPLTAESVRRAFDEVMRWQSPHPPGTQFNLDPRTRLEIISPYSVRLHFPEPDGLAMGKLRAMHLMTSRFWDEVGFGYARLGRGEGHW